MDTSILKDHVAKTMAISATVEMARAITHLQRQEKKLHQEAARAKKNAKKALSVGQPIEYSRHCRRAQKIRAMAFQMQKAIEQEFTAYMHLLAEELQHLGNAA